MARTNVGPQTLAEKCWNHDSIQRTGRIGVAWVENDNGFDVPALCEELRCVEHWGRKENCSVCATAHNMGDFDNFLTAIGWAVYFLPPFLVAIAIGLYLVFGR